MKINIQSPGFTVTKKLSRFVEQKLTTVYGIGSNIFEADVCLKMDNADDKNNKVCEIKLGVTGNDLFASRQSESFEEAVTDTIAALKHQTSRLKTSKLRRRHQ